MKESLFSAGCFCHLFSKLSKKKRKTHQGSHVKSGGVVCAGHQMRKGQGTEGNHFPTHMVQGQRQRHSNHHPTGTPQRERKVLVEVEASSRRNWSAAACQECVLGPSWMSMQGDQGSGSSVEVCTSCGGRRRGNRIVKQRWSSMDGFNCSPCLSLSCLHFRSCVSSLWFESHPQPYL